jgi:pimeloyl-ACP methyl ester carboxylesterase
LTTPARALLPDLEYRRMDVGDLTVNYAIAGSGPLLLLLHGYPQNHLMWRHVAPGLARDHTVVLADLRGHGIPEHMIGADPGFWVRSLIGPLLGDGARLDEEVMPWPRFRAAARLAAVRHRRPRPGTAHRPLHSRGGT